MFDRVETEWPGCCLVRADERWEADLSFWIDVHLRRDYFMPRRQLRELLSRPQSDTWVIVLRGEVIGLAVVWGELRLHNLLLDAAWRGKGIGSVVVKALGIEEVRAKTNMSMGDPTPFYQRLGFKTTEIAGKNGQIRVMSRDEGGDAECVEEISVEVFNDLKKIAAKWESYKATASARAKAAARTRAEKRRGKTASNKVLPRTSLREEEPGVKRNLMEEKESEENAVARING